MKKQKGVKRGSGARVNSSTTRHTKLFKITKNVIKNIRVVKKKAKFHLGVYQNPETSLYHILIYTPETDKWSHLIVNDKVLSADKESDIESVCAWYIDEWCKR